MTNTPQNQNQTQSRCYLLFSTTSALLSRTIRLATGSKVSHAAIAYECATTGRVLVMEASGSGFRGLTWETWLQQNELVHAFEIDVPTAQWQEGLGHFCDTLGTPYDSRRLALEVARHFSRGWTQRFDWANTKRNKRGVLCADAVADFLFRIGFPQFVCPPAWTPKDLLSHVQAAEAFIPLSTVSAKMPLRKASKQQQALPKLQLQMVA